MEHRQAQLQRDTEAALAERRQQAGGVTRMQELMLFQVPQGGPCSVATWQPAANTAALRLSCCVTCSAGLLPPPPLQVGEVCHASLVAGRQGGAAAWQPRVAFIRSACIWAGLAGRLSALPAAVCSCWACLRSQPAPHDALAL